MPVVAVKNNISDIGVHKLEAGGTITGKVPPRLQQDPAVTVVATDSHGVAIEAPHKWDPIGDQFTPSVLDCTATDEARAFVFSTSPMDVDG